MKTGGSWNQGRGATQLELEQQNATAARTPGKQGLIGKSHFHFIPHQPSDVLAVPAVGQTQSKPEAGGALIIVHRGQLPRHKAVGEGGEWRILYLVQGPSTSALHSLRNEDGKHKTPCPSFCESRGWVRGGQKST